MGKKKRWAKKNPAWEAGYTGYWCCREFGLRFSGEAVVVIVIVACAIFSSFRSYSFARLLASMSFYRCRMPPPPTKTFFVRIRITARPVPFWANFFRISEIALLYVTVSEPGFRNCNFFRHSFTAFSAPPLMIYRFQGLGIRAIFPSGSAGYLGFRQSIGPGASQAIRPGPLDCRARRAVEL